MSRFLLQKPRERIKTKDQISSLNSRLKNWEECKLCDHFCEAKIIQNTCDNM